MPDSYAGSRFTKAQAASSGVHELNQTLAMLALPPPAQLRTLIKASAAANDMPAAAAVDGGLESASSSFFLTELATAGTC